jgi:hypothetical protein
MRKNRCGSFNDTVNISNDGIESEKMWQKATVA